MTEGNIFIRTALRFFGILQNSFAILKQELNLHEKCKEELQISYAILKLLEQFYIISNYDKNHLFITRFCFWC